MTDVPPGGDVSPMAGAGGAEQPVEDPGLALNVPPAIYVKRGTSTDIPIAIERKGGLAGAVDVEVLGLPASTGAATAKVASQSTSGNVTLTALAIAGAGGPFKITLRATSESVPAISTDLTTTLYVGASPGSPDSTFGNTGKGSEVVPITGREVDAPRGAVLDAEGAIVVGGDGQDRVAGYVGWVARLKPNGELDPSFGEHGIATGAADSSVSAVALSGNAPIVAGTVKVDANYIHVLHQLDEAGTPQASFGTGGDVIVDDGVDALIPVDGGILVQSNQGQSLFLLDSNGKPSSAFVAEPTAHAWVLNRDPQARILLGEAAWDPAVFTVGRLTSSGAWDTAFGTSGRASFPARKGTESLTPRDVASGPNGSVVLFAEENYGNYLENEVALVRFTAAGLPDTAFGSGGKAVVSPAGLAVHAVVIDDGRTVVLYANSNVDNDTITYALSCFDAQGKLDSTFGDKGTILLAKMIPNWEPTHLLYDKPAHRAVVLGWLGAKGIGVLRLWL